MTPRLDETHDASAQSWVESANDPSSGFPLQNLPFGVFTAPRDERPRIGVRIGDSVLDLRACASSGLLPDLDTPVREACRAPSLNVLFSGGRDAMRSVRRAVFALLDAASADSRASRVRVAEFLTPLAECALGLPAEIGDYTDFYASVHHATNVGAMFRPDQPLLPNYKWIPIGYHGRASSIVASGQPVRRPCGQTRADPSAPPVFGASRSLDYELEIGAFVGRGNVLGEPVALADADAHLAGLCLVNDWSARDIQSWEYQPLGPFLAKNFATTISPWVVTLDALEPFRAAAVPRPADDPAPLAYLDDADNRTAGAFDVTLEVWLRTARMRAEGVTEVRLTRGSFRDMYWTLGQMLTHHASNGCNLRPGDLIASGTVSGEAKNARGCLLELTMRGREPIALPNGETRGFLDDGDEIILRGACVRDGFRGIGFGECRGTIAPARTT